jgi:ParB family chromosome partitioning protein
MAGKHAVEVPRRDIFLVEPEDLVIIEDSKHILYDPRINLPLNEELVASINLVGVTTPILARKDGDDLQVVAGRQRVRASREVNKRRKEKVEGYTGEPVRVPVRTVRTDEKTLVNMMFAADIHISDPPLMRAKKISAALNERGMSNAEVALAMGVTTTTISNSLALFDCSPRVQKAVENGLVVETIARKMKDLAREKQDELLEQMLVLDLTKGNRATNAISKVKRGEQVTAGDKHRMRSRLLIENFVEHVEKVPTLNKTEHGIVVPLLRYLLGYDDAEAELPQSIRNVLVQVRDSGKKVKEPKAKKGTKKAKKAA